MKGKESAICEYWNCSDVSLKSSDLIQVERACSQQLLAFGVLCPFVILRAGTLGWRGGRLGCACGQTLGDLWAGSGSPGLGTEQQRGPAPAPG